MDHATIAYWLTWVGTGAWVVCFWGMHRIFPRQDALLEELRELARTQHDILREVHPDVGEIGVSVVNVQKMPRSFQDGEVKAFCGLFRQNAAMNNDRILHQ